MKRLCFRILPLFLFSSVYMFAQGDPFLTAVQRIEVDAVAAAILGAVIAMVFFLFKSIGEGGRAFIGLGSVIVAIFIAVNAKSIVSFLQSIGGG